jgi:hypothetical protein
MTTAFEEAEERVAALPAESFTETARWVAARLADDRAAIVRFGPGDCTEYRFTITGPGTYWYYDHEEPTTLGGYTVDLTSSFGNGPHIWNGGLVQPTFASALVKEPTTGTGMYTAALVARFLSAVAEAIRSLRLASDTRSK